MKPATTYTSPASNPDSGLFFGTFPQKTPHTDFSETISVSTSRPCSNIYTFTGKERDEETGYGYFGARYMDHELMTMWLSVDPLSDKYPSLSPYNYCAWNPIRLVDLDGMKFDTISQLEANKLKRQVVLNMCKGDVASSIYQSEYRATLNEIAILEKSEQMYSIQRRPGDFPVNGKSSAGYTYYDVNTDAVRVIYNGELGTLAHELKHAFQFEIGNISFDGSGKSGGLLHDFYDEREAYNRGSAMGKPAMSDESIQKIYTLPMTNTTVESKNSRRESIIGLLNNRKNIYRRDGVTYKAGVRVSK